MSYTKTTWHTGDVVTSAKLNNAEAGIDNAQWKTESSTQLFSESVTTAAGQYGNMGALAYSDQITADSLTVTFDGTEYICQKYIDGEDPTVYYGGFGGNGFDFSEYPFAIGSSETNGNAIITETAGTYSVSATAITITPTAEFTAVVNALIDATK